MKPALLAGTLLIYASTLAAVEAKDYSYSVPPPNDTSLYFVHPQYSPKPVHPRVHHRIHSRLGVKTRLHRQKVARAKGGLYVYYALPAPACCGESWILHKAHCCAHSGVWQTSYYAVFQPAASDFIYSARDEEDDP